MARRAMVTRAFNSSNITVLGVNTQTKKAEERVFTLADTFADEEKALKACKKVGDSDDFKCASILNIEEVSILRGMDVQKFLELSEELDPETRKLIEAEEAEAEAEDAE